MRKTPRKTPQNPPGLELRSLRAAVLLGAEVLGWRPLAWPGRRIPRGELAWRRYVAGAALAELVELLPALGVRARASSPGRMVA